MSSCKRTCLGKVRRLRSARHPVDRPRFFSLSLSLSPSIRPSIHLSVSSRKEVGASPMRLTEENLAPSLGPLSVQRSFSSIENTSSLSSRLEVFGMTFRARCGKSATEASVPFFPFSFFSFSFFLFLCFFFFYIFLVFFMFSCFFLFSGATEKWTAIFDPFLRPAPRW